MAKKKIDYSERARKSWLTRNANLGKIGVKPVAAGKVETTKVSFTMDQVKELGFLAATKDGENYFLIKDGSGFVPSPA